MHPARRLALPAIALTLLVGPGQALAGIVALNNLDQPAQLTAKSAFVGQSFIAGTAEPLYGAQMQLSPNAPPSSQITLEVESRTAAGTVGQTLFSNFTSSYNAQTGLVTFLANASFEFQSQAGYWLVLSDPTAGGVTWDFTASQIYQSNLNYGLPSYDTSYYSNRDNGLGNFSYYQPSDGPQMFALIVGPAVPEPNSFALLGLGVTIAALAIGRRNRHPAGPSRARAGVGPRTLPPHVS